MIETIQNIEVVNLRIKPSYKKSYLWNCQMESEDIKQRIIEEIAKTEESLSDYKRMAQPIAPDVAIGRISRMDAINNKSITDAAIRNATIKLSKLKIALEKVGHADFGLCYRCKEPIPLKRILIKPEIPYCVKCAQ